MTKRLPIFFGHVIYNLRGGFLVRPLITALALGGIGAALSYFETRVPAISSLAPRSIFPTHADPQVAQVILSDIAGSVMTVVSIVFAILLMSLTLASMQYSPRIMVGFAQDRVTQHTLGIFLGTFCYCLAALPSARNLPHAESPVVTVLGAMLLALACVGWLLYFIHHISQAISVNHIVDNIARETEAVINSLMPSPRRRNRLYDVEMPRPDALEAPILNERSGYVRFIDTKRLLVLTKLYSVRVRVLRRVGHFAPEGIPLMMVVKGEKVTPELSDAFRAVFDLGPTRTLQQDVEFGILLIVDIALKAISPAVNDPSTAISCVDQLSRILIRFASREPVNPISYDPPGVERVSIPWLSFDRLVESAFEQIRVYAKSDAAVSLRMLRALIDIAGTLPETMYREMPIEMGRRIVAGCAKQLAAEELGHMRQRLSHLESLAASG